MESIGTFETEYELHLHELKDRHPIVHAWEARPGGEMQPNGRRAGEFTVDDALYDSFRFNLSRQIVGEVRGREVLAMLEAMQTGTGSLSTTHAESAGSAVSRLVTCAMKAGAHVTHDYAVRAISSALNIIVHVDVRTELQPDGTFLKRRWTSEIAILSPGERERGYAMSSLFRCPPGSTRLMAVGGMPDEYRELSRWGFDLAGYVRESQGGAA
jgi:Flp pilus assembly CpaF family ATPase